MQKLVKTLVIGMLMISFFVCGNQSSIKPNENNNHTANNQSGSENKFDDTNFYSAYVGNATIEKTVLVDEEGVKITATGLDYTDEAFLLELIIENNRDEVITINTD